MQKLCPVLAWECNREDPEQKQCIVNTAKSVQNILERGKVYVKATSVRIKK